MLLFWTRKSIFFPSALGHPHVPVADPKLPFSSVKVEVFLRDFPLYRVYLSKKDSLRVFWGNANKYYALKVCFTHIKRMRSIVVRVPVQRLMNFFGIDYSQHTLIAPQHTLITPKTHGLSRDLEIFIRCRVLVCL